jgi:hypothetical protein
LHAITAKEHNHERQKRRYWFLYLKSRYMTDDDPQRAAQKAFDQEVLDLNALNFTNEGPSFREFAQSLLKAGVKIPR